MENEIWKDVVGYEGLYQVSNLGRVRKIHKGFTSLVLPTKFIVKGIEYASVKLTINREAKVSALHNVVARAFLANRGDLPCVRHKNGDCLDNRLKNLEYCTEEEFILTNTKHMPYSNRKVRVLTEEGLLIKKFNTIIDAADFLGIPITNPREVCSAINRCCEGRQATAYGFRWRYA